jgi:hypothetical protein
MKSSAKLCRAKPSTHARVVVSRHRNLCSLPDQRIKWTTPLSNRFLSFASFSVHLVSSVVILHRP